jgi:hypothetical protein
MAHRPAGHAAAEDVEDDSQVHKGATEQRHLGDVGHPRLIWDLGLEVALDEIRGRTSVRVPACGAHAGASAVHHPSTSTEAPPARNETGVGRVLGTASPVGPRYNDAQVSAIHPPLARSSARLGKGSPIVTVS